MFSHIKLSRRQVTANVNIRCHVILRKQKQASFRAKKKTNFFVHAKCPNQAMTHASTTQCLLCRLSHSVIYIRAQALPNITYAMHACNALTTSCEAGYLRIVRIHVLAMVSVHKGHSRPKLNYHSTTIRLVSAPMLLNLCQKPIGMETHHFQPFPVIHGPNPDPDPLSPLYVIVEPRNLFQSIARTRFSM